MTSLRVLHVVPHLDRLGGYQRQAVALATHQRRELGLECMLLTHAARGAPAEETTPAGRVVRLPRGPFGTRPGRFWRAHGADVDVVHAHALHPLSAAVVALARTHATTIVKIATPGDVEALARPRARRDDPFADGTDPRLGPRRRALLRRAWRRLARADVLVALTREIEDELSAHGVASVRVPNGVDTRTFAPASPEARAAARAALELPSDAQCAAFVGRFAPRKDLGTLLDAAARLAAEHPRLRLLLVGEGPAEAALRARIAAHGLGDRTRLLARTDDVRGALAAADVFVNPARREGLPNAVLEAAACGLPLVLSRIAGHADLGGDAAASFAAGDAAALAAGLDALLRDDARHARAAAAARALVERRFALPDVAARLLALYRDPRASD